MIEIIHVSDLHFGKKTIKSRNLLKKIKEKYEFGGDKYTYMLVTGDITDNGIEREHQLAVKYLKPFAKYVHIVPGNHDYEGTGFWYSKKAAIRFDTILCPELGVRHKFFPKKPYFKLLDDKKGTKALIIGLNSCSKTPLFFDIAEGKIGDEQLRELQKILGSQDYKQIPKIVFLHHIPHRAVKSIGMDLRDREKLMRVVTNKIDACSFGHSGGMREIVKKNRRKPLTKAERAKIKMIEKQITTKKERAKLERAKDRIINGARMKMKRSRAHGIYFLNANKSPEDQACFSIKVDGKKIWPELVQL